jgi:hypothetical protein
VAGPFGRGGNGAKTPIVKVDPDLKKLALELKAFDPALRTALRRRLRAAAQPVAEEIRSNAATFSTTIPDAITVRSQLTGRKPGVYIMAARSKMPEGHEALPALQELGSKNNPSTIRHPYYGHMDEPWYDQPTHPYFYDTIRRRSPDIAAEVEAAADDALRAAGWRFRVRHALT